MVEKQSPPEDSMQASPIEMEPEILTHIQKPVIIEAKSKMEEYKEVENNGNKPLQLKFVTLEGDEAKSVKSDSEKDF